MKKGKIIVVVGPSGCGKSTLVKRVMRSFPELDWSVSYTTRPKRDGEVEGKDYFFVSPGQFAEKRGDLVEWAEVHGNLYGTSREFVLSRIGGGKSLLFDLDVQGADQMKAVFGEAKIIYVAPPSLDELEARLRGRGTDSGEVIDLRLENARGELARKGHFDHLVVNDNLEDAFSKLESVVKTILEG